MCSKIYVSYPFDVVFQHVAVGFQYSYLMEMKTAGL